ncbi:MAG: hypothetical protein ACLFN8_02215 [Candidatus Woesearchaeota archaeon]
MEIKIDTQKESREDIQKIINFLKNLINESPEETKQTETNTNYTKEDYETPSEGIFGLFDDDNNNLNKIPQEKQQNNYETHHETKKENDERDEEKENYNKDKINIIPY